MAHQCIKYFLNQLSSITMKIILDCDVIKIHVYKRAVRGSAGKALADTKNFRRYFFYEFSTADGNSYLEPRPGLPTGDFSWLHGSPNVTVMLRLRRLDYNDQPGSRTDGKPSFSATPVPGVWFSPGH